MYIFILCKIFYFNKEFFYSIVNVVGDWLNGKFFESEGWVEVVGVLGFVLNVNIFGGLLFVKLKLVVVLLNWKVGFIIVEVEKFY